MNEDVAQTTFWSQVGIPEQVEPISAHELAELEEALGQSLRGGDDAPDLDCAISLFVNYTILSLVDDGHDSLAFHRALARDPGRTLARRDLSPGEFRARWCVKCVAENAGIDLETHEGGAWAGDFASDYLKRYPEEASPKPYAAKQPLRRFIWIITNIALRAGADPRLPQPASLPTADEGELCLSVGLLRFVQTVVRLAAERGKRASAGMTVRAAAWNAFDAVQNLSAFTYRRLVWDALKTRV